MPRYAWNWIGIVTLILVLVVGCATQRAAAKSAPATATPAASAVAVSTPSAPASIPLQTETVLSPAPKGVLWALVGSVALFRSRDEGQTWERRPLPETRVSPFAEISFIDDHEGWFFEASSPGTQCLDQGVTMWHTSTGGSQWESLGANGIAERQCKRDLSFVDARTGFLSASDPNHQPVIYRTADGGNSWSASRPLPDPPGQVTQTGGFTLYPRTVYRIGGRLLVGATGWRQTWVYASEDGGQSWSYTAAVAGATDVAMVTFLDSRTWWATGAGGLGQIVTRDGGHTWQPAPATAPFAAGVPPVVLFGGPETGYATVRGGIARTRDGGRTWTLLQPPMR